MPRKKIDPAIIEAAYAHNAFVPRLPEESERLAGKKGLSRIMYVENKSNGLAGGLGGAARIGRVTHSKSRSTIYYQGRAFRSLKGSGYKSNYIDIESGEHFWISGPKKDGKDRLYGERTGVEIDEDVREEYWTVIRNQPERKREGVT
jgi:hypothetical protein